jgi:hemoglobin-like flavoprotein
MTPQQIELVQSSFQKVAPNADAVAQIFYDRLFAIAPEVRPMFPDDMTDQRSKLMRMLGTAVTNLHRVEAIVPVVQDLGRRHVAYGVNDAHYDTVAAALIWTLEQGLGEDFTPDLKDAWVTAYTTLAGVMKDAARKVAIDAAE